MRIAFLFDPPVASYDCFTPIVHEWLKGLIEVQHQVKVITRKKYLTDVDSPHERLEWAEAMNSWSWWEAPKLFSLLLSYAPQVVHLALGRTPSKTSLWPTLAALKNFRIPLILSTGDACQWPPQWRFQDQTIEPQPDLWATPWLAEKNPTLALESETVFVPGPLPTHQHWRKTLSFLMKHMKENPEKKYQLAWSWNDVPLAERHKWRELWQQHIHGVDLTYLENATPSEQLRLAQISGHVLREVLPQPSWWHSCFDAQTKPVDFAINQLVRSYRDLSYNAKT